MVVQLWILVTRQAGFLSGVPPFIGGCLCVWLTGKLLRRMSPPFGALVAKQAGIVYASAFVKQCCIVDALVHSDLQLSKGSSGLFMGDL